MLCSALISAAALPYIDPGSGSMIIQMLLGGAAAVAVAGKFYWRRFLSVLGIRPKQNGTSPE